jgi:CheY-like chemotaxis protein
MDHDSRQSIVLLVEGKHAKQHGSKPHIDELGAVCASTHTLAGADALLRHFVPDVVVIDYELSDGSGIEYISKLRQNPLHRATPIILLTGDIHPSELERAVMMGIYAFIARPFRPEEFQKLVGAAISDSAERVRRRGH